MGTVPIECIYWCSERYNMFVSYTGTKLQCSGHEITNYGSWSFNWNLGMIGPDPGADPLDPSVN